MPENTTQQDDPERKMTSRQRKAFALAKNAAVNVVRSRFRVLRLVRAAYAKMVGHENAISKVQDDLVSLLHLSKAWASREYRNLPWKSLLYSIAAILYFVNPVDLIPDVLAGLGFIDDVAVIAAVVGAIRKDLDAFQEWESARQIERE